MCNTSRGGGESLIMALPGCSVKTPHLYGFSPPENARDVTFGEDASRGSRAHQAKAAVPNTVIGILHLHHVPNIPAQRRACHPDPYPLPLHLLGPAAPPT